MANLPLDIPVGVLVKTTCVDFPGLLAGSFFLKGCNLRCPYCYNIGLVLANSDNENLSTIQELFDHLEKRQGILNGFVISGGEPLLNPYTPLIIKKAKSLGYKIKLDTNGSLPDQLQALIDNPELKPDFIAMDIKTSAEKYGKLICNKCSKFFGNTEYFKKTIEKTAKIVASYPADSREYRTVLVPPLVSKTELTEMAEYLPEDASWQFAQFRNENCLDPSYNEVYPYTDKEAKELIDFAKTLRKGAELR